MLSEVKSTIRPVIMLHVILIALTGLAYPLLTTGLAQVVMPGAANGSMIEIDGKLVGSRLIGQSFAAARYFHGRPSAAGNGYDAANSSGSNLGPASKTLDDRVKGDVAKLRAAGVTGEIPADLVTTSASGLDPDISPEAAMLQVADVAKARGLPQARLRALIEQHTHVAILGLIGEPRVNLLELNIALDRISATKAL